MMQSLSKYTSLWRRRSVRDAMAIAGICFFVYLAANSTDIFDKTYEFAKRYEAYELDDLIVVAIAFGFLMLIYALRRAQDLKLEINKRELAEKKIDDHARRLAMAVNNMPQGIVLFDSDERLVVCNNHYLEMYGLSREIVKPGASLLAVLQERVSAGLFDRNPEEYRSELLVRLAKKEVIRRVVETSDRRKIEITDYPMVDGSWIATHEDRTELQRSENSFRLLFEDNPVAMWLFDLETLRYLAVNDAAVACYGYSREQFLTMTATETRVEDKTSAETHIRELPEIQNEQTVVQHRRADGKIIHVAICSRIMTYENREVRLSAMNDITARKLTEDELERTKMFLNTVIENVPMPILVKTAKDSRFTLLNKASEELFSYSRDQVLGKTPHDIYHQELADDIVRRDKAVLLVDSPVLSPDHEIMTPGRGMRRIISKKVAVRGIDGEPEYILSVIDDVTERRETEKRIAHMAHSDPLTDLPNRAAFSEHLSATLKASDEESRSFAVLCMDLDGFKEINDIYGHSVGDMLLCEIADRLRMVADGIFVARLGGDEFTMIAANETESSIAQLTERLQAAFVDDFEIDGHRLPQALSIGVAIYPTDGVDAKTLLNNADAALYRAKAEGSGSVQFFKAEMAAQLRERAALQADLKAAILRGELRLHYQPQLKMTGEIIGFEALARWNSPTRGIVSPAEFIPLAEESSLILVLGEWVLREACREAAAWETPLKIAINVSPIQFRHGDLPRMVHSILLETGLAPSRLELEITEGVLIDDFSRALSVLRRLKSLGVQIAMDDFGKGYSSLSYLRAFPFDKIKIDRSFISDLDSNHQSVAIVRAVIGLGRSLDIPILAEGVETQAQHALLVREGCSEVQGYLTGRPLAIEDYADVIGRKLRAVVHAG